MLWDKGVGWIQENVYFDIGCMKKQKYSDMHINWAYIWRVKVSIREDDYLFWIIIMNVEIISNGTWNNYL